MKTPRYFSSGRELAQTLAHGAPVMRQEGNRTGKPRRGDFPCPGGFETGS
jgi:hypothetical protein